jgi:TetR/AcrR family transcriptional regulator, transcriptional repressor for nem operon
MRYKTGHKEEARARLVAAVGRGFRQRGYGGIGVDGLAKEAEVTSGAFYGHFPSKEAAFKAAVIAGIDDLRAGIEAFRAEKGDGWLEVFVDFYLGYKRTCDLTDACALQSLAPEVVRSDSEIKTAFQIEMYTVAEAVAAGLHHIPESERLNRAWALLALLSGAVTLARSLNDQAASEMLAQAAKGAALDLCLTQANREL